MPDELLLLLVLLLFCLFTIADCHASIVVASASASP